jgi:hypothetical protein
MEAKDSELWVQREFEGEIQGSSEGIRPKSLLMAPVR